MVVKNGGRSLLDGSSFYGIQNSDPDQVADVWPACTDGSDGLAGGGISTVEVSGLILELTGGLAGIVRR